MSEALNSIQNDCLLGKPFFIEEGIQLQLGSRYVHIKFASGEQMAYLLKGSDGKIRWQLPGIEDIGVLLDCIRKGMFTRIPDTVYASVYVMAMNGDTLNAYLPYT